MSEALLNYCQQPERAKKQNTTKTTKQIKSTKQSNQPISKQTKMKKEKRLLLRWKLIQEEFS